MKQIELLMNLLKKVGLKEIKTSMYIFNKSLQDRIWYGVRTLSDLRMYLDRELNTDVFS